jgi:hypothetical protein
VLAAEATRTGGCALAEGICAGGGNWARWAEGGAPGGIMRICPGPGPIGSSITPGTPTSGAGAAEGVGGGAEAITTGGIGCGLPLVMFMVV